MYEGSHSPELFARLLSLKYSCVRFWRKKKTAIQRLALRIKISREIQEDKDPGMRITLNIVGSLLVLSGAVWLLQGINLLPGSFMTGQIRWAVYGGIAVASGIALLLGAKRLRKDHR